MRAPPRLWVAALALLAALGLARPAAAWWEAGHQATAAIAWRLVQPRTRAAIAALLRRQTVLETPTCPAGTLAEAAIWPDCIKALGDRFAYQSSWHYQDAEICRPFDLKPACANGNCLSAQIARAQRMLADRALPDRDRLMALAFLVHFVGDLHQPLHDADHDGDQGGNKVKALFPDQPPTNLHAVWDGLLADRALAAPPAGPAAILGAIPPAERRAIAAGSIEDWSREGWELAKRVVYGSLAADICRPTPAEPVTIDAATADRLVPVVRRQVGKAGIRLARLLDEALDGDHPEVAHPPKPAAP